MSSWKESLVVKAALLQMLKKGCDQTTEAQGREHFYMNQALQ